eukprot:TRINITY_DN49384_c0_g1_i1.p2 TRINITY_DN49384_c0_g1~~TRINITY_DN49384_c0_g1_i1.p2  ORF type:complete len:104 (-),score=6.47 TRINITY_DN49384_c0_g1_i1:28-339(-)
MLLLLTLMVPLYRALVVMIWGNFDGVVAVDCMLRDSNHIGAAVVVVVVDWLTIGFPPTAIPRDTQKFFNVVDEDCWKDRVKAIGMPVVVVVVVGVNNESSSRR